jgi:hypothetical protein
MFLSIDVEILQASYLPRNANRGKGDIPGDFEAPLGVQD